MDPSESVENDANLANGVPMTQPPLIPRGNTAKNSSCIEKLSPTSSEANNEEDEEHCSAVPFATQASPLSKSEDGKMKGHSSSGVKSQDMPNPNNAQPEFLDQLAPSQHSASLASRIPTFSNLHLRSRSDSEDSDSDNDAATNLGTLSIPIITQLAHQDIDSDSGDSDSSSESEEESDSDDDGDKDDSSEDAGTRAQKHDDLFQRREANVKKNKEMLISLGLRERSPQKPTDEGPAAYLSPTQSASSPTPSKSPAQQAPRGMLFPTPYNNSASQPSHTNILGAAPKSTIKNEAVMLKDIEDRYPHRETQIRQLWHLLSPALPASGRGSAIHIPPPIFVTGPTGTGKSCIVRDVVAQLQQMRPANANYRVGTAYVNCATCGGIDEIVHSAYRQLAQDMKVSRSLQHGERRRKRKRGRRSLSPKPRGAIAKMMESGLTKKQRKEGPVNGEHSSVSDVTRDDTYNAARGKHGSKDRDAEKLSDKVAKAATEPKGNHESGPQVRRSRRLKENEEDDNEGQEVGKATASSATTLVNEMSLDLNATKDAAAKEGELTSSSTPASTTAQIAVASFGQELHQSLFHRNDCGVLILDQAERMLSLSSSPSGTAGPKSNFLAQLLLLPRTRGLNLTIVVVTKSILLEHSRFNNVVNPERSLSTIASAIQPLKVHFQAYKGKETFKKILSQPMLLERIVGPQMRSAYCSAELDGDDSFSRLVVRSFLNTLVQTLYGSIRDVKELVRLGRSLWPLYVLPLSSGKLERTVQSVQKSMSSSSTPQSHPLDVSTNAGGKQLLSFLDQQILPHIRSKLEKGLYSLSGEDQNPTQRNGKCQPTMPLPYSSGSNNAQQQGINDAHSTLPQPPLHKNATQGTAYLSKCLMLAGFICQHNKADKDKRLFNIQKNGKQKNANKKQSVGEDLAFGSTRNAAPKSFRPRLFPMERMLSVFVSIVGLNQDQNMSSSRPGDRATGVLPSNIGTSDFLETFAQLRDVGVLHDKANSSSGTSSMEEIQLTAPKYWCSLTRDEADALAKSIDFPLDNYLY